jgi:predicted enzyme related to lactoylglutathione lyase
MLRHTRLRSTIMAEDWSRPVVHWEIEAQDPEKIAAFYGALFNWTIGDGPVRQIGPGIGAPEPITGHIREGKRSAVVLNIQVLNLRETLDRVPGLGGKVLREPFDLPQGPTLASILDPEGNRITLVQQ